MWFVGSLTPDILQFVAPHRFRSGSGGVLKETAWRTKMQALAEEHGGQRGAPAATATPIAPSAGRITARWGRWSRDRATSTSAVNASSCASQSLIRKNAVA